MAEDQESHLKSHAQFFDGLLSLIPASMYYEQDRSDQWQRKKQSKEQARAAKRAKLDPSNAKSVKDVMDENDPDKRKSAEDIHLDGIVLEKPMEGVKMPKPNAKKQKKEFNTKDVTEYNGDNEATAVQKLKAERKEAKKERKRALQVEKRQEKKQRLEEKSKRRVVAAGVRGNSKLNGQASTKLEDNDTTVESSEFGGFSESNPDASRGASNSPPSTKDHSPVFDAAAVQSGTSSISSFPDLAASVIEKPKIPTTEPQPSHEDLKLRLEKRLAELRAARKVDKEDGTPKITRQQLLEQRRAKEAQRKAHKKALRKEAKEVERLKREQEIASGSPLMSPSLGSPASKHGQSPLGALANSFSFGRIGFDNGQMINPSLDAIVSNSKQKQQQPTKLVLQAVQRRKEKLAALDPEKRAEAAQKDMWNAAERKASGEKVRDDASLLKKTLKRKEHKKKKSEKEWDTRLQGVAASMNARQKKREENLQKRKEEKGNKGKKKASRPKARPGFEGSLRAGGGKKSK